MIFGRIAIEETYIWLRSSSFEYWASTRLLKSLIEASLIMWIAAFDTNPLVRSWSLPHFNICIGRPFLKPGADLSRMTSTPRNLENHWSNSFPSATPLTLPVSIISPVTSFLIGILISTGSPSGTRCYYESMIEMTNHFSFVSLFFSILCLNSVNLTWRTWWTTLSFVVSKSDHSRSYLIPNLLTFIWGTSIPITPRIGYMYSFSILMLCSSSGLTWKL